MVERGGLKEGKGEKREEERERAGVSGVSVTAKNFTRRRAG